MLESTATTAESRLKELLDLHPPVQITVLGTRDYKIDTFKEVRTFPDGFEVVREEHSENRQHPWNSYTELYVQGRNTVFKF